MPDRKWCSSSIESALRTQTRLHHLIDTSKVGRRPTCEKILDATAPSYRFTDPFVGSFDRRSLHKYFDLLKDRLSCTGAISRRELAFFLRGPMKLRSHNELQFWREAPRIGLTGVAEIEIGERGVAAERVAYDLNLASDILCRALALR
jgi:hypothetical protein